MKIGLFVIDPQQDFMDVWEDGSTGALAVPGATDDMKRLSAFIDRAGDRLNDIQATLDSHQPFDVAHPSFWVDENGNHPAPFTIISADDVRNGVWRPRSSTLRERMLKYVEALEAGGKYPLITWPEHCLIGSPGYNVQADLLESLYGWSRNKNRPIGWVSKGTNPYTEHYGGLMAEVVDPNDPRTDVNRALLNRLQVSDIIYVAGEASSHCVKATVEQIAENIGDEHLRKIHLLTDCMSPVPQLAPDAPDFPAIAEQFKQDMEARGMTLTTSVEALAA